MWVRIEAKGLSLAIIVVDAIDYEIVRLSIALAEKRETLALSWGESAFFRPKLAQ